MAEVAKRGIELLDVKVIEDDREEVEEMWEVTDTEACWDSISASHIRTPLF